MIHEIIEGNCEEILRELNHQEFFSGIHLTFLDPPFNQDKAYNHHNDNMPEDEYWAWMKRVTKQIYGLTVDGGSIYFMQREKNADYVIETLRRTGWQFQNLIIWQKLAGGVPSKFRFGKRYQVIAFFTKGKKAKTFNNLRYEPPLLAMHEYERETGMYLTDVWEDIRELTSGFFAGDEAIRINNGELFSKEGKRFHKQQTPIELLTRIILTSTKVGDFVLDPFAGTGVTSIVAKQLKRNSISIELDPVNVRLIKQRLEMMREADNINKFYYNYLYSENLDKIWSGIENNGKLENYYYKKIPKRNLNDVKLMEETIKNILINSLNIGDDVIKTDFRFKDKNNKIHRFELVVYIKPNINLIFRITYAKTNQQADFWIKRIQYEQEIVKEKEPESQYYAIIAGKSFNKNLFNLENENLREILISFPGWGKILKLPNFLEKIQSLNIINSIKSKKQVSLDNF